jgi:hypothetical protein
LTTEWVRLAFSSRLAFRDDVAAVMAAETIKTPGDDALRAEANAFWASAA